MVVVLVEDFTVDVGFTVVVVEVATGGAVTGVTGVFSTNAEYTGFARSRSPAAERPPFTSGGARAAITGATTEFRSVTSVMTGGASLTAVTTICGFSSEATTGGVEFPKSMETRLLSMETSALLVVICATTLSTATVIVAVGSWILTLFFLNTIGLRVAEPSVVICTTESPLET